VRNRLNHLLQHAVRGMLANPTARPAAVATWVQLTLEEGVGVEEAARVKARRAVGAADGPSQQGPQKVAAPGTVIQSKCIAF
jgi:hypothetical protein